MSRISLYIGNDNTLMLRGLHTSNPKQYVNDADVEVTLRDENGDELAGQAWPLVMTYVAGSSGDYEGTFEDTLVVEPGDEGGITIDIEGSSLTGAIELDYVFVERRSVDYWTSRRELENMFGLTNVTKWADLENNRDEDEIVARIDWAAQEATEDAKLRLHGGPANGIINAPRTLRKAVTRLAGVLLYESRGVMDTSDEKGAHRLLRHERLADEFFYRVAAGQLRLPDTVDETTHIPFSVPAEDEDEQTDEDFFAV